jgi:hypothetical protein
MPATQDTTIPQIHSQVMRTDIQTDLKKAKIPAVLHLAREGKFSLNRTLEILENS